MTKSEAGLLGAKQTREIHGIQVCPLCLQPVFGEFYKKNGNKGGLIGGMVNLMRHPELKNGKNKHFSEIGKKGGRPRRERIGEIG